MKGGVEGAIRDAPIRDAALKHATTIAMRVYLCDDGSSGDIACKAIAMVPEFAS